jgi:hypothetical protein
MRLLCYVNYSLQLGRHGRYSFDPGIPGMGIAWPERIAIVAALFVAIGMALFWILLAAGARTAFDARLDTSALHWFVECEFLLVIPIWVGSRIIHFAIFSLRRRRSQ